MTGTDHISYRVKPACTVHISKHCLIILLLVYSFCLDVDFTTPDTAQSVDESHSIEEELSSDNIAPPVEEMGECGSLIEYCMSGNFGGKTIW